MRVCRNWKKILYGVDNFWYNNLCCSLGFINFWWSFFSKRVLSKQNKQFFNFARMIFCSVRFTHWENVDNLVGDLSGTHIKSTQKVAVLSGNIRTSVGQGSSRDHLVTMLPPIESWGNTYCTVPIPGNKLFKTFHILYPVNFFAN